MADFNNMGIGLTGTGTTVALAETLRDVTATFNDRNITYNGS